MAKSLKRTDRYIVAKEIGSRIKTYRQTRSVNMNQKEFAQYIGIDQGTLSKMENGDSVTIENLKQVSEKCNLSMDFLFFGEPKISGRNEVLGLSEDALNFLSICKNSPILSDIVNRLLSHKNILFFQLLGNWKRNSVFNLGEYKDISIDDFEMSSADIRNYVYENLLLQVMYSIRDSITKEEWETTNEERKAYDNDNLFDTITRVFKALNNAYFSKYPTYINDVAKREFLDLIDALIEFCIYTGNTYVFEQFLSENTNGMGYYGVFDVEYALFIASHIKTKFGEEGKQFIGLLKDFTKEWITIAKKIEAEEKERDKELEPLLWEQYNAQVEEAVRQVEGYGYHVEREDNGKH